MVGRVVRPAAGNKVFLVGTAIAILLILMAIMPGVFAPQKPLGRALVDDRQAISSGTGSASDNQGVATPPHGSSTGARISILVGLAGPRW
ncbi:hypothetical protein [Nonomuraea dietziae]|uniref:hypothetical protein n=1 Tax=Nonomuraea dietziae TaxID=65515 RepID=UPI0031DFEC43